MNWFFIALVAPILWSLSNHIDKYLIDKHFKDDGIGALIVSSAIIGIFLLPIIYFIQPSAVDIKLNLALLIILNGILYIFALFPYMYALEKDEASIVVPLFQLIPIFSYFLGIIFLDEILTIKQILSSLLIIIGAIGISLELEVGKKIIKKNILLLMILTSFLYAINGLIFKIVAIKEDFLTTSFWEYVGFSISAFFLLIFVKSYRKQFLRIIKNNTIFVFSINAFNEVINIIGKIAMDFATLLAPLALALSVNGFHPFFVFVFGVFFTIVFPEFNKESLNKKHIFQKVLSISAMCAGAYFLNSK